MDNTTNYFIHDLTVYNNTVAQVNAKALKVERISLLLIAMDDPSRNIQAPHVKKIKELSPSTFLYNRMHSFQKDEAYQVWITLLEIYKNILEEAADLMEHILFLAKPLPSAARRRFINSVNEIIIPMIDNSGTYTFCSLRKAWQLTYHDVEFLLGMYDELVKYRNVNSLLAASEELDVTTSNIQITISLVP